ncbi:MAG: hypothetical protein NDF54_04080 [archaeon GB-1867-035]|nr:hypothetical protein [Candidatus Culexmicrobium profundum]
MNNCHGYTRILEAILALILLSAPFLLFKPISPHNAEKLREIIMDTLVKADVKGDLTRYVYDEKWNELENLIISLLPSSIKLSITVTDAFNNVLYTVNLGLPNDGNIVVVSYILMFRGAIRIVTVKASW